MVSTQLQFGGILDDSIVWRRMFVDCNECIVFYVQIGRVTLILGHYHLVLCADRESNSNTGPLSSCLSKTKTGSLSYSGRRCGRHGVGVSFTVARLSVQPQVTRHLFCHCPEMIRIVAKNFKGRNRYRSVCASASRRHARIGKRAGSPGSVFTRI